MRPITYVLSLLAAGALPLAAQDPEAGDRSPTRVFESDEPIRIRIEADLRTLFRDRDTTETIWQPAKFSWVSPDDSGTFDIQIGTRGHFRLRSANCPFPPLRLRFPREERRGTMWRGQGTLKLGTHCRSGNQRYEQIVHQEFLVYRMYNIVSDTSFRVRFAHATYVDTRSPDRPIEAPAFFIEDIDDVAARIGGHRLPGGGVGFQDIVPMSIATMSTFLYMVGGTDWSVPYEHNTRIIQVADGRFFSIAYDFDWTGYVNAPYARPDPSLGTRTVRERVWRGPCLPPDVFAAVLAHFDSVRERLVQLIEGHPGLDPRFVRDGVRYIEEFYKEADDIRRRRPGLANTCGFRR
jgi:hypothetical protein